MQHRAARVTEVCILDPGTAPRARADGFGQLAGSEALAVAGTHPSPGLAVLAVTARQGSDEVTRVLTAPPATIRHAAVALARHYGLHSAGDDRWCGRS